MWCRRWATTQTDQGVVLRRNPLERPPLCFWVESCTRRGCVLALFDEKLLLLWLVRRTSWFEPLGPYIGREMMMVCNHHPLAFQIIRHRPGLLVRVVRFRLWSGSIKPLPRCGRPGFFGLWLSVSTASGRWSRVFCSSLPCNTGRVKGHPNGRPPCFSRPVAT